MNKRKILILILVVGALAALLVYNYMYQDHRDISTETAAFKVSTKEISGEFTINSETATAKYLDKTIQITGNITAVEEDNFELDSYVLCYSDSITISSVSKDQNITIKGRFIGYDELFENIKLDQVTIIK